MVLLVPDDIPEESLATTVEGNVKEMCALYEGWDPRYVLNTIVLKQMLTTKVFKNSYACVSLSINGGSVSDMASTTGHILQGRG